VTRAISHGKDAKEIDVGDDLQLREPEKERSKDSTKPMEMLKSSIDIFVSSSVPKGNDRRKSTLNQSFGPFTVPNEPHNTQPPRPNSPNISRRTHSPLHSSPRSHSPFRSPKHSKTPNHIPSKQFSPKSAPILPKIESNLTFLSLSLIQSLYLCDVKKFGFVKWRRNSPTISGLRKARKRQIVQLSSFNLEEKTQNII
jgi:hypothetical protein